MLRLVRALDALFQAVVGDPGYWSDEALESWVNDIAEEAPLSRQAARQVRAAVRSARKLRKAVLERPFAEDEWHLAVDDALGSRGWLPSLRLAMIGLEAEPSAELFEEVQNRFRMVHFEPWQEGVTFEDWLQLH